jgi:DNA-binding GntR family transcriptional regulator
VTEVNDKDLTDVYHLLALMESDAAAEVARRASPADLKELEQLHRDLSRAEGDREKFFAINERFHVRLLELADNRWRMQMVADLRKVMKLNRHNSLLKAGRVQDSLKEHQALMEALVARNADLAGQRMREHFANGLEAAS